MQSTTVVNAGCCVVTHLKFVEIQNLEGRRQNRHLQCCSLRTAYHQAPVFHRNESQTKCCLAVTSTTHAWQSKAIFFLWRDIVGAEHHNCQRRALYVFTGVFLRCESKETVLRYCSLEEHRRCRAPLLSTQSVVCVHGSFLRCESRKTVQRYRLLEVHCRCRAPLLSTQGVGSVHSEFFVRPLHSTVRQIGRLRVRHHHGWWKGTLAQCCRTI